MPPTKYGVLIVGVVGVCVCQDEPLTRVEFVINLESPEICLASESGTNLGKPQPNTIFLTNNAEAGAFRAPNYMDAVSGPQG